MPRGIGSGSAELSSVRVPTLENCGQCASSSVPKLAWESEQEVLPSAALGLIENPSGRVTVVARISESDGVSGLSFCGTFSVTSSPLAVSASEVDGLAESEGWKESWSQPVVSGQGAVAVWTPWS